MANNEDGVALPLPTGSKNGSYGTVSMPNRSENQKNGTPFDALFVCATAIDFGQLGLACLFCLLGASLQPLVTVINYTPFSSAVQYEELDRARQENLSWSEDNQTELLAVGQRLERQAGTALLLVSAICVLQFIFIVACYYLFGSVAVRTTKRLRHKYVHHILSMDMGCSEGRNAGELTAMLDENISKMCDALENNLPQAMFNMVQTVASLLTILVIRWDIGLIVLSLFVPGLALFFFGTKFRIKMLINEQTLLSKAAAIATECFMCIKTVICFTGQKQTIQRYNDMIKMAMGLSYQRAVRSSILDSSRMLVWDAIVAVTFLYGSVFLNDTPPFELVAMAMMALALANSLPGLNMHINAVLTAIASAQQINDILSLRPEIEVPSGIVLDEIGPEICFTNVTFSYPTRPELLVIKDVSFKITAGQKIAIVGESGSGKSSIVSLLMRFFDPHSGTISVDAHPIRSLNIEWLRNQFGYVSQEPVLFDMSIRENLLISQPSATEQQLQKALQQANAMHFISELDQGLDTRVGERGTQLSGGQKQRVAIARALLRNPRVLIFDEATSSLDSENEALVQAAIHKVSKGRTTITIAHRLSTILGSHKVLVMEKGEIVEHGSPQELIEMKEKFCCLLNQQNILMDKSCVFSQSDSSDAESHKTHLERPKAQRKQRATQRSADRVQGTVCSDIAPLCQLAMESTYGSATDKSRSTVWAIRTLIALHPRLVYVPVVSIASLARAIRMLLFFTVLSLELDAFSYSPEIRISRVIEITQWFWIPLTIFGFLTELALYIPISKYADELTSEMRNAVLKHLLSQNLAYFDSKSNNSGNLSSGLATHSANIRETISSKLPEFLTCSWFVCCGGILIIILNPLLGCAACSVSAIATLLRSAQSRILFKEERKLQPLQLDAIAVASEAFGNIQTVKAFNLVTHFVQSYKDRYAIIEKYHNTGKDNQDAILLQLADRKCNMFS